MTERIYFQDNRDGSCDILIVVDRLDAEFGRDLFSGELFRKILKTVGDGKKVVAVRTVKLIVSGGLTLAIPFSQFASQAASDNSKYAMSYIYFGTAAEQIQYVNLSAKTLNTVSPAYFELNSDGSLKTNNISESFVSSMKNQGIKVVPFLSNGWNRQTGINALNNMDQLTDSIVQAVTSNGLDGVNIDIENLTEAQRDQHTLFVKMLREKMPLDKEVSIAVAANPWAGTTGWQGSYDYAALSQYVDYMLVMAYDEHYSGGDQGAVASIGFVENSIKYALNHVPKEQIVIGIPFYGRLWSTDGTIKGEGISLKRISELSQKYRSKVFYDEASGTPVLHITVDEPFTLNGKTIKNGNYAIWYENADSIKQKLNLVGKYGLKGAGNWSAGQETADVWDYYELWLNGHFFSDISASFAKDDIIRLTSDGIIRGVSNTLFGPEAKLTRAQAAVILARTLGLSTETGGAGFSDTAGYWAEKEIAAARAAGLLTGYADGTFRPEAAISRDEMAAIIARMLGSTYSPGEGTPFSDVGEGYWAYDEIMSLAKLGILRGYSDNTYRPQNNLTREEAAAIIERAREASDS